MSVIYKDSPSLASLAGENRTRIVKILKAGRPARLSCPSKLLAGGQMKIMLTDPDLVGATTASVQVRVLANNGRLRSEEETILLTASVSNDAQGQLWGILQVIHTCLAVVPCLSHYFLPYYCISISFLNAEI